MKLAMVFLTNGFMSGGAIKHLRTIIPLLLSDYRISALHIFVPEGSISDVPPEWPVSTFKTRPGAASLREALASFGPDVVFVPSARHIRIPNAETVIMVRNMEPLETPFAGNSLLDKVKNIGRRVAARRACHSADRIIAVSQHVRTWIENNWSVPQEKIGVVEHGVEEPSEERRPEALAQLADRPFVFASGSIRPARGLSDLIQALAMSDVPADLQLVFAGSPTRGAERYHRRILQLTEQLGVIERVHWAGNLGTAEMAWCFNNCDLFVMTSRAEACPNTVLEALAHGCLSVSGDNPPMPEFFLDAALYYRTGNSISLGQMIGQAVSLPQPEKDRLRARARARASEFSWQATANKTIEQLQEVIAIHH